jgi:hypothetical protein
MGYCQDAAYLGAGRLGPVPPEVPRSNQDEVAAARLDHRPSARRAQPGLGLGALQDAEPVLAVLVWAVELSAVLASLRQLVPGMGLLRQGRLVLRWSPSEPRS